VKVAVNLLHLVPGETGGAETYARRLLPALAEADPGLELTLYAGAAAAESLESERWKVAPLRFDPRSRVRRVLAEQTLLPAALRRERPDLLHNLFNTGPAVSPVPQVTTIHDLVFKRYPETHGVLAKGVEVLVPLAARRSKRVLTDSEASKTDIVELLGVPPDRVDVAPLGPGIPENVRGPTPLEVRRRFGVADAPLVLSVLAKRPHKNAARLIEALAAVPDAVLVMPGYSTGYELELRSRIESAKVADRVRLLGWVDDATLEGLYRAADCFVFPSLAEGFGLPVLEAMLRGAPVACSNTTSLPEVAGDAALYFDPLDVEAIAGSVRKILEDETVAARLRSAGRKQAKRFNWAETAQRTLESYHGALAPARGLQPLRRRS
jgi:glycosyltransferase involved in cell wall biosynthesis